MNRSGITGQRLVAVFLLACVLFNYPLLSLFNKPWADYCTSPTAPILLC